MQTEKWRAGFRSPEDSVEQFKYRSTQADKANPVLRALRDAHKDCAAPGEVFQAIVIAQMQAETERQEREITWLRGRLAMNRAQKFREFRQRHFALLNARWLRLRFSAVNLLRKSRR